MLAFFFQLSLIVDRPSINGEPSYIVDIDRHRVRLPFTWAGDKVASKREKQSNVVLSIFLPEPCQALFPNLLCLFGISYQQCSWSGEHTSERWQHLSGWFVRMSLSFIQPQANCTVQVRDKRTSLTQHVKTVLLFHCNFAAPLKFQSKASQRRWRLRQCGNFK